jgi:hypothetical protein
MDHFYEEKDGRITFGSAALRATLRRADMRLLSVTAFSQDGSREVELLRQRTDGNPDEWGAQSFWRPDPLSAALAEHTPRLDVESSAGVTGRLELPGISWLNVDATITDATLTVTTEPLVAPSVGAINFGWACHLAVPDPDRGGWMLRTPSGHEAPFGDRPRVAIRIGTANRSLAAMRPEYDEWIALNARAGFHLAGPDRAVDLTVVAGYHHAWLQWRSRKARLTLIPETHRGQSPQLPPAPWKAMGAGRHRPATWTLTAQVRIQPRRPGAVTDLPGL